MAQSAPLIHSGNVTFEDVQIRAADGRGVDLDYRIRRIFDLGIRLRLPLFGSWAVVNQRLHGVASFSRFP
jgi:hypothetical protein